jgi:heptosyltransferase-2
MSAPQSILVRTPNWTGDVVMSTPGFRALRAAHPKARITAHIRPGLEPLLHGSPWFDRVIPVQSYRGGARAIWSEGRALRSLEPGGFDLGVCIPESFSSALLMRAAGVRRIAGFRRGGRGVLLHEAVSAPAAWGRRRLVARERFVLELLAALDCPERGTRLELFTSADEDARIEELLVERGAADGVRVVLAPGASFGPSKCWPPGSFAAVGDSLTQAGASVLLVGTAAEASLTRAVAEAMEHPAIDLAGALDLGGLKALLRTAGLVVCNDAGARHIAVAFGVPVLMAIGPTSLEKTDLNLERVQVFHADVDCRPCYQRECPIDHRCMTRIPPSAVAAAALDVLKSEAP